MKLFSAEMGKAVGVLFLVQEFIVDRLNLRYALNM